MVKINLKRGGGVGKSFGNVVLWTHDREPRDDETCDHRESDEKVRSYVRCSLHPAACSFVQILS